MQKPAILFLVALVGPCSVGLAGEGSSDLVSVSVPNGLIAVVQHDFHLRYGAKYPLTYRIGLPPGSKGLAVQHRHASGEPWIDLPLRRADSTFNAVEAVRFDDLNRVAYVSAAFSGLTDSLLLRFLDSQGNVMTPVYRGVCTYYDDRRAAVTASGDDCADWTSGWFPGILSQFRSRGLFVTAGVITGQGYTSTPTWQLLQREVDSGYVEVASHSRTHSYTPYSDPEGEVIGSCRDILANVRLPGLFSIPSKQYVYTWIAPYGDYDGIVDSLLGVNGLLVSRLYALGDSSFSTWEERRQHFAPINLTLEIGAPSWGGGETSLATLNGTFDRIVAEGGIYHLMWHPQVLADNLDVPYLVGHLNHIARRSDIWYVNLGHLYLYHLMQMRSSPGTDNVVASEERLMGFELFQNYPNPFNSGTQVRYQVPAVSTVTLVVYDVLGRRVATLAEGRISAGSHVAEFDGTGLASGVYLCRLEARSLDGSNRVAVRATRMLLLR